VTSIQAIKGKNYKPIGAQGLQVSHLERDRRKKGIYPAWTRSTRPPRKEATIIQLATGRKVDKAYTALQYLIATSGREKRRARRIERFLESSRHLPCLRAERTEPFFEENHDGKHT